MQNLNKIDNILKEIYEPLWNQMLGIEPTALLAKVKKVPVVGNKIVAAAPIGLSGGFGYSEEGYNTPASGNQRFSRFITDTRDMYVNVCISQKAISLGTTAGAMADALKTEIESAYATAKWNVGRSLFGNGTGKLAVIKAAASDSKTIQVDDFTRLKEGLTIDVYGSDDTAGATGVRIDSINRTAGTDGSYEVLLDTAVTATANGYLTVQNSLNREIDGLGLIFDDSIDTIYGVKKSENIFLKPITANANGDITDSVIQRALRSADRDKNSKVDMLLCGDDAYDTYVQNLRDANIRVEDRTGELDGGFKTIKFIFGNREVDIVNESFVPSNEMWGVDTGALELHQTDWRFADQQTGGIFTLMENKSTYRALLYNYGNLICKNPGGCVRIFNCASM